MKLSSQFRWLSHLHCMEIPSQGRHFPGIHGPKTLKSSSKHFLNRRGHGVFLGWQRLYPPSEVEIASSPPEKLQEGPNKESTVCVVFDGFSDTNAMHKLLLLETWNIPWDFLEIRRQIDLFSCDACAWCTACSVKIQRRVWAPKRIWPK